MTDDGTKSDTIELHFLNAFLSIKIVEKSILIETLFVSSCNSGIFEIKRLLMSDIFEIKMTIFILEIGEFSIFKIELKISVKFFDGYLISNVISSILCNI